MSTNHEYTPTTGQVRDGYSRKPPGHAVLKAQARQATEFDRWLAERDAIIETAAEQRGAVMVMDALKREASDSSWEGIVQPGRSLQELVDHMEHGIRADRLEGDNEKH